MDQGQFDSVVGAIYDTVTEPDLWPAAIDRVCAAGGATVGLITGMAPDHTVKFFYSAGETDPHYDRLFLDRYAAPAYNPVTPYLPHLAIAEPVPIPALSVDYSSFARTEIYDVLYQPQGLHYSVVGLLSLDNTGIVPCGFMRARSLGDFETEHLTALRRLLPHVRRAVLLAQRFGGQGVRLDAMTDYTDGLAAGLVGVDPLGRIQWLNEAAGRMIGVSDGLGSRNGFIRTTRESELEGLRAVIASAAALAGGHRGGAEAIAISRPSGKLPYLVQAYPIKPAVRTPLGLAAAPGALLIITDPEDGLPPLVGGHLVKLFGLSPTEAQVAVALASGKRVGDLAAERGVAIPTLRSQVQAILRKTRTDRQVDLVRLLLRLQASLANDKRGPML